MLFTDRAEIGMVLGTALAGPMSTRGGAGPWEGRAIDSRPPMFERAVGQRSLTPSGESAQPLTLMGYCVLSRTIR